MSDSNQRLLSRLRCNSKSLTRAYFLLLDEAQVRDVADALRSNTHLTCLCLVQCEVGDGGAAAIADALRVNRSLADANLRDCKVGDAGAGAIAAALVDKGNDVLESLILSSNRIGVEGAKAISVALVANCSLTTLFLADNRIGAAGAKLVADALVANRTLTTLVLHGNSIGDDGAKPIAAALVDNHTLTTLNLRDNRIGAAGASAIADALSERYRTGSRTALSALNMSSNDVGDAGGRAIASMLRKNNTIQRLDLSECGIGDGAAKAIAAALVVNNTIKSLDISCNYFGDVGAKALAAATLLRPPSLFICMDHNENVGQEGEKARALALCTNVDASKLPRALALIEELLPAVDCLTIPHPKARITAAAYPFPHKAAILDKALLLIIKHILGKTRPIPDVAMPLALQRIGSGGGHCAKDNDIEIMIDPLFAVFRDRPDLLLHKKSEQKESHEQVQAQAIMKKNTSVGSGHVPAKVTESERVEQKNVCSDIIIYFGK